MDDLSDARWEVDFEMEISDDLPSCIYATHVKAEDDEDYISFFVRPETGKPTAKIVFIVPTASYLANANNRFQDIPLAQ